MTIINFQVIVDFQVKTTKPHKNKILVTSVKMEVKVPREVRNYQESIVLGLSMRQFFCSLIAAGVAVIAYFFLKPYLGNEGVSWVCILVSLPIALIGFVKYHEMTLEYAALAYIKSEWLMPKRLVFISENYYISVLEEIRFDEKSKRKRRNKKEKKI